MSYVIPPSAGVKEEQAKALGEAVRALHRAGWHDTARHIAVLAQESGVVVDDGKRLIQSRGETPPAATPATSLEVEALRAQFASFADYIQALLVEIENGARDWGHLRAVMSAKLSLIHSTARKMAAGQPAYVPTFRVRLAESEAELTALRVSLASQQSATTAALDQYQEALETLDNLRVSLAGLEQEMRKSADDELAWGIAEGGNEYDAAKAAKPFVVKWADRIAQLLAAQTEGTK